MLIAAIVFWVSVGLVAYAYAGYPVLIWLASRGRLESHQTAPDTYPGPRSEWPKVSLIIAAYREERWILQRLQNAINVNYPPDRLEVLVGVDGDEDATGELVRTFGDPRVRLIQYSHRRGKASVLNDTVPQATGDVLVFSDATSMMQPDSVLRLVRHFADPLVGGVAAGLELVDAASGRNVDGAYWKYENVLKVCEARLGALLGVSGGLYALRRALYRPIPTNSLVDDFLIGMSVHEQGRKLLYDPTAVALVPTPSTIQDEFHRRVRMGAGGFQSLVWLRSLLAPRHGWLAVCFLSHKGLRWTCPAYLILALVANAVLAAQPFYGALLVVQGLFYSAAAIGLRLPPGQKWQRPLRLPAMFVSMNLALAVGFWRWARGVRSGTWKRTERLQVETRGTAPRVDEAPAESCLTMGEG